MNEAVSIVLIVLAVLMLLVLCIIWHHITIIRYDKQETKNSNPFKWYQLFGKLNEIGFWVKFIVVLLFGLTLFISLHYLCCTYPHKMGKVPDFDYFGVIASFFAVLVTLLVGWNIYSTIKAKEELKGFTDRYENRLSILETCCADGKNKINELQNLEKHLDSRISNEVCYAVMGYENIRNANYKQIIQVLFNSYENTVSESLKRLALQQLAILFSSNADRDNYDDFIEAVINAVEKKRLINFSTQLFDGTKLRDKTLEISNVSKTLELINRILEKYPKE